MALKLKNLDLSCGIRLTDVYFRIRFVSYDSLNGTIHYNGNFFISEEARRMGEDFEIAGVFLDDNFKCDTKDGNLFELAYNNIKAKTEELRSKSLDEIKDINQELFKEYHTDSELINPLYYYFRDAEDC
jgi:hypothetical protein